MNDASLIASSRFKLSPDNYIDLTKLSSLVPTTSVPSRFEQVLDESSATLDRVGSAVTQSNNVEINDGYSVSNRNAAAQDSLENPRFNVSEKAGLDASEPNRFSETNRKDNDYNLSSSDKGGNEFPVSRQEDKSRQASSRKMNPEKESDVKLSKNSSKKTIDEANKKKNKDSDSSENGNVAGILPGATPLVSEQIKHGGAGSKGIDKSEATSLSKQQARARMLQGQAGVKSAHEQASLSSIDKDGEVNVAQKGDKKKLPVKEILQGQKNTDSSLGLALDKKSDAHAVVNVSGTSSADSRTLYKPFKKTNPNINVSPELNIKKGAKQINAADLLKKAGEAKKSGQGILNAPLSKMDASLNNNAQNTLNKDGGNLLKGYATSVSIPVGQPGWDDGLSNKVVWLTKQNFKLAEIHLNPAELGPVDIKIKMHKDQADITFNSPNADIRTLLENTLPKLRDMLSQSGISLGNMDVSSQQNFQRQTFQDSGAGHRGRNTSSNTGLSDSVEPKSISTISQIIIDRAVDFYV